MSNSLIGWAVHLFGSTGGHRAIVLRALSPRQSHTGVWHAAFADPPTDGIAWSIRLPTLFPLSAPQLPCFHFHSSLSYFPSQLFILCFILSLFILSFGYSVLNLEVSD